MALATYTIVDLAADPVTILAVDSAIGSAPTQRPSAFVPPGTTSTIAAPPQAIDTGTGTQMASRVSASTRASSVTVSIDPGLIVNG